MRLRRLHGEDLDTKPSCQVQNTKIVFFNTFDIKQNDSRKRNIYHDSNGQSLFIQLQVRKKETQEHLLQDQSCCHNMILS